MTTKHYIEFNREDLYDILVNRPAGHPIRSLKFALMGQLKNIGWNAYEIMRAFADGTIHTQASDEHARMKIHVRTHKEMPDDISFTISK